MTRVLLPVALIAVLSPLPAQAAFYAGADLSVDSTSLTDAAPDLLSEATIGPQIHVGYHLRNFAVELGYGTTRETEQDTTLRFNRLTGDGMYYVPLGGFLNLVLTGGVTQDNYGASTFTLLPYTQDGNIKEARDATTLLSGNEFHWRGGGGLSFSFSGGYELHIIGRYEPLKMRGFSNNDLSLETGFNIDLN